jgi:hypothetical protein
MRSFEKEAAATRSRSTAQNRWTVYLYAARVR